MTERDGAGKALTAKQRCFVDEYMIDLNATQAAIRSGYSAATANRIAAQLLAKPHVAAAIAEAQAEQAARTGITADRVLKELAKIGFSDIRKAVNWKPFVTEIEVDEDTGEAKMAVVNQVQVVASDEIDDETAAAISEISQTDKGGLKVKLHDKRAALVDIGKHLGMFVDKHEHSGPGGGPIKTETRTWREVLRQERPDEE